ncbi:dynamin family protein [Actibacterium sp. 188UL27-1]|uniref:dynamin family protein n=1 Tax=Actibacterium sp. 188UL27-1 TaxID=2786961 RepID=UPI001EF3F4F9|nr:dynamin family protein [Actibacterium sp. 188UL27-1]
MTSMASTQEQVHQPSVHLGVDRLEGFVARLQAFNSTLNEIAEIGGEETAKKAQRLQKQLLALEPNVTMIGQIKAGKTSLVNAMVGQPDLLPADVNPWTSVVTSLHLNATQEDQGAAASFQFFNMDEWEHLVDDGGRIGELASRAGADDELEKVREQIAMMREKTRQRLGRKFEMLLGQKHDYGYFDEDLIQRYVCLGDDFDDEEDVDPIANQQGRFADITKSADLFLKRPGIPMPLCIRDTPGVNDTFMIREQITINALRDSRTCVVVLSAHQALTSMDMALIRMIANMKSREVIIFVNRIDELSDPASQVPEIRDSIIETLRVNNGPADPQIIFGSAYWANLALAEGMGDIVDDSAASLLAWADAVLPESAEELSPSEMVWELSGLPDLFDAISERIVEGVGQETLDRVAKRAMNLASGVRASGQVVSMRVDGDTIAPVDKEALALRLRKVEDEHLARLTARLEKTVGQFAARIDQSHERFLDRALESLLQHLEKNGEDVVWKYSPDGLRMLLRSSYQVLRRNFQSECEGIFAQAAQELSEAYKQMFSVSVDGFGISPPTAPVVPPPVSLGQTIALDLQTSWWKSWWKRRRGYRAFASGFYELIEAETSPIVNSLKDTQTSQLRKDAESILRDFFSEQRGILMDVAEKADVQLADLKDLFGVNAQAERERLLNEIFDELDGFTTNAQNRG